MNKLVFVLILLISTLLIFGCISDNVVSVSKDKQCSDRNYYVGCAVPVLSQSTYHSAPVTSSIKCTSTDGDTIYKVQYGGGSQTADGPYFYFNQNNEFLTQCGGLRGMDNCDSFVGVNSLSDCNVYCKDAPNQYSLNYCINSCFSDFNLCVFNKPKNPCAAICEKFPSCCF